MMHKKVSPNERCLCGSSKKYKRCCKPLLGGSSPPTAEALMRSRYVAYAQGKVDYIIETTHPDGPLFQRDNERWRAELVAYCRAVRFEGLKIIATGTDSETGDAFVEFFATLFQGEQNLSFGERSLFRKHDGYWKYFSGQSLQQ